MTIHESARPLAVLLRLSTNMTGAGEVYQYNSSDRPITSSDEGLFTPTEMELDFGKHTGRADEETVEIALRFVEPLETYASGVAHAPIFVDIWTCDPDDVDATLVKQFAGKLIRMLANAKGKAGICKIEVGNVWTLCTNHPLGISATTRCPWRFGDQMCGFDVAAIAETVTVSSISGSSVVVAGLSDVTDIWSSGYLRLGDLAIAIKSFSASPDTFTLVRPPPDSWDGEDIQAVPGCNKTITQCRSRWDNEAHFGAFGFAIPADDPRAFG